MKKFLTLFLVAISFLACKTSENSTKNFKRSAQLKEWINNKSFEIESHRANPRVTRELSTLTQNNLLGNGNNASSIDLIGNPNFLKVHNDSVSANLPYFGTRQMGGSIGANAGGLQFHTKAENYTSEYDKKKKRTIIKFDAHEEAEFYSVTIIVFENLNTVMTINSTQRTSIGYDGTISEYKKENE